MQEIVIVIPDLYFPSGTAHSLDTGTPGVPRSPRRRSAPPRQPNPSPGETDPPVHNPQGNPLPGLEHAARFGHRRALESGWRPWLAHWLGRDDLASAAPAAVAAAATASAHPPTSTPPSSSATAWLATPVHLIAGLTSLHLDRRSLLRLSAEDLAVLARDFNRTFGTEFNLKPTGSGQLLMRGPGTLSATTTEPARALVSDLEASLPQGSGASSLKRLGAELEMWLHAHPLNEARGRRGELPISTLWLWGGGAHLSGAANSPDPTALAFGSDPYLLGLWHLQGAQSLPLPTQLSDLFNHSPDNHTTAQHAAFVVELTPLLHSNPHWTVFEALAELDRRFLTPALAALHQGKVASVVVIANDRELHVRRRDRLKFWRRPQPGLTGLQD